MSDWCFKTKNNRESAFSSIIFGETEQEIYVGGAFEEESSDLKITGVMRFYVNNRGDDASLEWSFGF